MNPNQQPGGPVPTSQDNQPWPASPAPQQQVASVPMSPSDFQPSPINTGVGAYDEVQSTMRRTILKIIGIMSAVSVVGVAGIFLLSSVSDSGISDRVKADNSLATYEVPTSWNEDTVEGATSYVNGVSSADSQANIVVIEPFKITFDSKLITQAQADDVADEYESILEDSDTGFELAERSKIEIEGFEYAYEFNLTGVASDGVTELRGISHLLIDKSNNLHTIEFVSIVSYWNSNEAEILKIINSYQLKEE